MAGRKLAFDEELALKLYHEHKTDTAIANAVGSSNVAIYFWRKRRNLPSISYDPRKHGEPTNYRNHTNYKKALNPEQAIEMRRFLVTLQWAARKALSEGAKLNLNGFINEWRCQEFGKEA
ncbi:MAG: hypothetical protein Q8911_08545 [Bacillota bacterium]|nr:hypothetical protein [Bacillota bacterium]